MKTIQVTLDEKLLSRIDRASGSRNRSAFFRQAAEILLKQQHIQQLEKKHQAGYKRHPVSSKEFSAWESEQAWVE